MMSEEYRGFKISKQSKLGWIRVYHKKGYGMTPRVRSNEAAKALIDCVEDGRTMTPAEHGLIYK